MKVYKVEDLIARLKALGYAVFENDSKNYNLNIVGIRNPNAKPDEFADTLAVFWKYQGQWVIKQWPITTYPGLYYLQHLINSDGTAILKEGQYRNIYGIRLHRGKYDAMCQTWGDVKCFRDGDKDNQFDLSPATVTEGSYGINIHKSTEGKTISVGAHSAGCQVFQIGDDFHEFMSIAYKARDIWGNKFTYTLIRD